MVLNIYKEQLDKTGLVAIANEFESGSEHHLRFVYLIQTLTCMLTCRIHYLIIKQCNIYYHRYFLIITVQNTEEIFSYLFFAVYLYFLCYAAETTLYVSK